MHSNPNTKLDEQHPKPTAGLPDKSEFHRKAKLMGEAIAKNLGKQVLAEHEADLARLPKAVRDSKTPEEWLKVPASEILRLARNAEANQQELKQK